MANHTSLKRYQAVLVRSASKITIYAHSRAQALAQLPAGAVITQRSPITIA